MNDTFEVRHFLRVHLCISVVLLLAACGSPSPQERPVDVAIAERVLLRGNGAEPESLDPHLATSVSAGKILINLFEGLVRLNAETLAVEPGMAESWTVSEDGRVLDFRLRTADWSDGEPVKASDFVFAFRRLLDPAFGASYAFMLFPIENARKVNAGELPVEALGVEAPGDRQLRIRLEENAPQFLCMLAHWTAFPLPEHTVRAAGPVTERGTGWARPERWVGNGAYVLTEWRDEEKVRIEKNPQYWQADTVTVQAAEYFPFHDAGAEERAFRAGEIHLTYSLPRHRLAHYRMEQPEALRVDTYLESVGYAVNLSHPALSDVRVRRALSLALNRSLITEQVLYGVRQPAFQYVPPGIPGYPAARLLTEDVQQARDLLAEAGYPEGRGLPEIRLMYFEGQDTRRVAEVLQQQWLTTLGLRVELDNVERQTYFQRRRDRDFDLCYFGWVGDYLDPMTFLGLWVSDSGNNLAGWDDRFYDEMIRDAADADPRLAQLAFAEKLLLRSLPVLPLYFGATQYLKDPRVEGWHANLLDWHPLRAVSFSE